VRIAFVVAVVVLAALAVLAQPARAIVRCGTISVPEYGSTKQLAYRVRVVKGPATCRTARRVLKIFMTRDVSPRGWFCARGHASQNQAWAAACGSRAGAIVRAYGPIRG
jgi:hypothetical protein